MLINDIVLKHLCVCVCVCVCVCDIRVWFGIRVIVALSNEFGSVPSPASFLKEFEQDWY